MFADFPQHLYIHWPFCKNKCHYCDFVALEKHDTFYQSYHRALLREFLSFSQHFSERDHSVSTIFFGGGTPSLYPASYLEELFRTFSSSFCMSGVEEITLEVNPGGITRDMVYHWRDLGINRLSIGVQILDEGILASLNRFQSNKDVVDLIKLVSPVFDSISVDLILGLPGTTDALWKETLHAVVSWPIHHVSLYFLSVHEDTPLFYKLKKERMSLKRDDEMVDMYERSCAFLEKHHFIHYEVSNFARYGYESLHNKAYWERRPYKGFGLGAASFDGKCRMRNEKNLSKYIKSDFSPHDEKSSFSGRRSSPYHEKLTAEQVIFEKLMLGLRQKKGIDLQHMIDYCGMHDKNVLQRKVRLLQNRDLIECKNDKVLLTTRGMALENEVILYLTS